MKELYEVKDMEENTRTINESFSSHEQKNQESKSRHVVVDERTKARSR